MPALMEPPRCEIKISTRTCPLVACVYAAVKKTTAGLLKLIYPHRTVQTLTDDEFDRCFELGVECRKRIVEQLATMQPSEFRHIEWTFERRPVSLKE